MKYYYLISSLPELDIDDTSLSRDQLDDTMELIRRNLEDDDQVVWRSLLHSNDNQNLLFVLCREYLDFEIRAFIQPTSVPGDVLENYRREYSSLPNYMMDYLNDLSGSFSSLTMREMEQTLNQYFLDHLIGLDSEFLNTYFSWVRKLDRTIGEVNLRSFHFLQTRDDSEEWFLPRVRTLHGLTDQKEIANQLQPLMESKDLEAIERKINQYYWEFADCWQGLFSAEQVFAYMVKLLRLYRWKGFPTKGETARANFEELVNEIKLKSSSAKMPKI